jgi:hypothetical protein
MTNKVSQSTIPVETINRATAISMLMHGLLREQTDAATFKPANVSINTLIKIINAASVRRNRLVSVPTVNRYARDMSAGNWQWTGDAIKIDVDGYVRDGQHRLLAIVDSDATLRLPVVRNLDPEAQLVVDIGRPRVARDQSVIRGHGNASHLTSTAKLILRWRAGRVLDNSYQPSITEVMHEIEGIDADAIKSGVNIATALRTALGYAPIAVSAAWSIEAYTIDPELHDRVVQSLRDGSGLTTGDPILALRNTIIRYDPAIGRRRLGQAGQLYQYVKAWNASRKNETNVQLLRVPIKLTSDNFPKLV